MRRGMLSLKLISNPKSRRTTFQKRKKSLIKKAYELSTLCDVRTCIFIVSSSSSCSAHEAAEFETWPSNRNEIESMIRAYKTNNSFKTKRFDLYDFFSDRKAKIETETSKLREKVEKINRPNWDQRLDCLSEQQLKLFMGVLDSKIGAVQGMIQADFDHFAEAAESLAVDSQCPPFSPMETEESPEFLPMAPTIEEEELDMSGFFVEDFQSLLEDKDLQFLVENTAFHF